MVELTWLESIVTLINIHILLIFLFHGKIRSKIILTLFILFIIPLIIANIAFNYSDYEIAINTAIFVLSFFSPYILIKNIGVKTKLFVSLFYMGLSSALTASINWILPVMKISHIFVLIIDSLLYISFLVLCILVAKKIIFAKIAEQTELIPGNMKAVLIVSIWLNTVLVNFISTMFLRMPESPYIITVQILTALLTILMGILCPLLIANSISGVYFKTVSHNMEDQIKSQMGHYETLAKTNQDIRKFKHDFNNLKLGLQKFLTDNDVAGALNFLNECEQPFHRYDTLFKTGNRIADALFEEKNGIAKSINTDITFKGIIPDALISPMDLCVIFGNALDNALEACTKISKEQKKVIKINSAYKNRFLFIAIQNPIANRVEITDNKIETTKKDKQWHGIGLGSIRKAISNYSGELRMTNDGEEFILEIDLDFN